MPCATDGGSQSEVLSQANFCGLKPARRRVVSAVELLRTFTRAARTSVPLACEAGYTSPFANFATVVELPSGPQGCGADKDTSRTRNRSRSGSLSFTQKPERRVALLAWTKYSGRSVGAFSSRPKKIACSGELTGKVSRPSSDFKGRLAELAFARSLSRSGAKRP